MRTQLCAAASTVLVVHRAVEGDVDPELPAALAAPSSNVGSIVLPLAAQRASMQVYVRRDEEQGYGLEFDDEGCVTAAEGAAEEAGVRVGWTITAVDGDAVAHRDEIFARLAQLLAPP